MRLIDNPEYGPLCRFGDAHIYYMLTKLDKNRPISRFRLSEEIDIGEGSVRRMTTIMKEWGTITVGRAGIVISEQGCRLLQSIPMKMVDIRRSEYVTGAYQQGVLVRGVADKITNGTHQRDRGIIMGANGASVFLIKDGILIMPKNWNMDVRDPEFAAELRSKGMEEGDVVIVCGASDPNVAAISSISISLELL